jgi:hypothetical protein
MDRSLNGGAAGLIAGAVVGALSLLFYTLGVCNLCLVAIGGGLSNKNMLARTVAPAWTILGFLDNLIISLILGVVLAYILHFTGSKHAILKGMGFGAVVWLIDIVIIAPLAGYIPKSPQPLDLAILLGYHLLFGSLTAFLIIRLSKNLILHK